MSKAYVCDGCDLSSASPVIPTDWLHVTVKSRNDGGMHLRTHGTLVVCSTKCVHKAVEKLVTTCA